MPTYDEVKTKIKTLRQRILKDMTYGMFERRKKAVDATLTAIKTILSKLAGNINVASPYAVDTRLIELYNTTPVTEIGEKKVAVDYADDTILIDGRTVIPFDVFTYNPTLYAENVKSFADALSKGLVVFRIDNSYTPPDGDFEDVSYVYYVPEEFIHQYETEFKLYDWYGAYGVLPKFAEFLLYGLNWTVYNVNTITGSFDWFERHIDGYLIEVFVGTGGIVELIDPNTGEVRNVAYKYVVHIVNTYSLPVEVVIGNKPHKCPAGYRTIYLYLTDIHLKSTPYKIFQQAV